MTEENRRRPAYLEALARLQPRWDHDLNDDLGAVRIQIDLLILLLADERGSAIEIAKLTPILDRSLNAIQKLQNAVETQLLVRRGNPEDGEVLDLAAHVKRLGSLLGGCARLQLKASFSVVTPEPPLWIEGGEPALREAVTIAAVEMLFLARERESVTMRLAVDGERAALRIEGPRKPPDSTPWLVAVRETLADFGGRVEAGHDLSLDLIIPLAAVPR